MTPPDHHLTPTSPTPETDHPEPSTASSPTEAHDKGRNSDLPRTTVRRLRERVPSAATATQWLRSAVTTDAPGTGRIPPKMRSTQVGAAVTAVAVLGVIVGHSQPGSGEIASAAHTAPLAAAPGAAKSAPTASHPGATASFFDDHGDELGGGMPGDGPSGLDPPWATHGDPLDEWIDQATDVLRDHGVPPNAIDEDDLRTIIKHESGGDPRAANDWDSNAKAGTPSKGLMQTIDPTFHGYALPGHQDIWNPVDNIIAASLYSIDRYGSVSEVPGVEGMNSGGDYEGY